METFVDRLKTELTKPLPGVSVQYEMAPAGRDVHLPEIPVEPVKESAVVALLFPKQGKLNLLLMKRVADDSVHSGQLSFPGGRKELSDENLKATALRELYEEVGIEEDRIAVLGALTPLYISVSSFQVFPFLAYADALPPLKINSTEVEKVFYVDIDRLLDENAKTKRCVTTRYLQNYEVPCFLVEGEILWGATAMITNEILALIKKVRESSADFS